MTIDQLSEPVEMLPAYEDTAHVVRRIVREELTPVIELLQAIRGAETEIDEKLNSKLHLVGG